MSDNPSEKFLTRFYQCPPLALKLASVVDAYVTAEPKDKEHAEVLLRKAYAEIATIPTVRLPPKVKV